MITQTSVISQGFLLLQLRIRTIILLVVLLFGSMQLASAQEKYDEVATDTLETEKVDVEDYYDYPKFKINYRHFVSVAPSALLNFTPGLQLGYERVWNGKWALIGELGGLLSFQQNRRGFRLKAEGRHYFPNTPKLFFALEGVHKFTSTAVTDWLDAGTHEQLVEFNGLRNFSYGSLKFGFNTPFRPDGRLFIDIGVSAGLGLFSVRTSEIPSEFSINEFNDGFFFDTSFRERSTIVPIAAFSLKLKYAFY